MSFNVNLSFTGSSNRLDIPLFIMSFLPQPSESSFFFSSSPSLVLLLSHLPLARSLPPSLAFSLYLFLAPSLSHSPWRSYSHSLLPLLPPSLPPKKLNQPSDLLSLLSLFDRRLLVRLTFFSFTSSLPTPSFLPSTFPPSPFFSPVGVWRRYSALSW